MLERTDIRLRYTKALLALCPLLDIAPKIIQSATSATQGHVSNWHTGRRTIPPEAEQALFGLITEGAKHLATRVWPDDYAAMAHLHALMRCLVEFDGAWLEADKADEDWIRARATPMVRALNTKLAGCVAPRTRQRLTQTRDEILDLVEAIPAMRHETKTRVELLRALAADLAAPTIPVSRKVVRMSEVLETYFGERVWVAEPTTPTPAEAPPAARRRHRRSTPTGAR